VVLVPFRATVVVATGKMKKVVRDPISWDCYLEFWDH
jgi:hypothetical protein